MTTLLVNRVHYPVTTLGPGLRAGIWTQGCSLRCPGCISRDTWEPDPRRRLPVHRLLAWLRCELDDAAVVAVADGLGGHAAGEVAAGHAVRRLAELGPSLTSAERISDALRGISDEIALLAKAEPSRSGMGATVAGVAFTPTHTWSLNVGGSRVFVVDGGYRGERSVPDNPGREFLEPGEPPPPTSTITQALGGSTATPPVPHVSGEPADGPSQYLICSDGLTDLVALDALEEILNQYPTDDERAVRTMWAAAMNAGCRDNITVVLACREAAGRRTSGYSEDMP